MAAPSVSAVPDILAPGLRCVFCGINPGRRSSAAGHHFANPRNDFWRLLADSGLTPRRLDPSEQWSLLELGYGLTNAAYRTTKGSGDLRRGDFAGSRERLERIAAELRPGTIAFVGKAAYQGGFGIPRSGLGLQERMLGATRLFVLLRPRRRTPRCPITSGCGGSRRSQPRSGASCSSALFRVASFTSRAPPARLSALRWEAGGGRGVPRD